MFCEGIAELSSLPFGEEKSKDSNSLVLNIKVDGSFEGFY